MDTPRENAEPGPGSVAQPEACPWCGEEVITRRELVRPSEYAVMQADGCVGPEWLETGADVYPHDRRCEACSLTWQSTRDGGGVLLADLQDLWSIADVTSNEELGPWLEDQLETDWSVWVDHLAEGFIVGMRRLGTGVDFPIALDDLWEQLHSLEDDVTEHGGY